jgi:hypothetical protein
MLAQQPLPWRNPETIQQKGMSVETIMRVRPYNWKQGLVPDGEKKQHYGSRRRENRPPGIKLICNSTGEPGTSVFVAGDPPEVKRGSRRHGGSDIVEG